MSETWGQGEVGGDVASGDLAALTLSGGEEAEAAAESEVADVKSTGNIVTDGTGSWEMLVVKIVLLLLVCHVKRRRIGQA